MPGMPRPKKSVKIVDKIIGKPDNRQSVKTVYEPRQGEALNTSLDGWYNHKI